MRALVYDAKQNINIVDKAIPTIGNNEVLIKVHLVGICGSDIAAWNGAFPRIKQPVVLGHEFVGEIVAIRSEPNSFQIGDRVVVLPIESCGSCCYCKMGEYNRCEKMKVIGYDRDGGMADFIAVPKERVLLLPDEISFEKAVLCEPFAVAVHMVKQTGLQMGDSVLIAGAGPIGLSLALVAHNAGASTIVLTDVNDFRLNLARKMGFIAVDAKKQSYENEVIDHFGGRGADIAFEVSGQQGCLDMLIQNTKTGAVILLGSFLKKSPCFNAYDVTLHEKTIVGSRMYDFESFQIAINLLAKGKLQSDPMVTDVVSFEDAIEKGFHAIKNGSQVMKVVIKIN